MFFNCFLLSCMFFFAHLLSRCVIDRRAGVKAANVDELSL